MWDKMQNAFEPLFGAVSKNLLQESHARRVVHGTYDLLCSLVPTLITAPAPWLVNIDYVANKDGSADVDLHQLTRDFTTHVSIRMLAGSDFLAKNPNFPTDLFTLDGAFPLFALGLPAWTPLAVIQNAVAARKRLLAQVESFSERIEAVATGTADSELQARLADVNGVFWDRAATYRKDDFPMPERGAIDLALFWAMNANTSPFVFWITAYLYADPKLLARVRAEVDPLISAPVAAQGQQDAPAIESLDAEGILTRCPLLKATYLETFRVAHGPSSVRYVEKDFSVADPALPKTAPPVRLRKGTFLTIPWTTQQCDSNIYPNPNEFRPERFLSEKDGEIKVGYGTLKP